MHLAGDPRYFTPMYCADYNSVPVHQVPLDDLRHPLRSGFAIEIAQDSAGIQDVGHHLSFSLLRWCFNRAEREGPPAKSPRVSSTSFSETGSRMMRDPCRVTAMRLPGAIPSDSRISAGMTSCPFVLTVVILF